MARLCNRLTCLDTNRCTSKDLALVDIAIPILQKKNSQHTRSKCLIGAHCHITIDKTNTAASYSATVAPCLPTSVGISSPAGWLWIPANCQLCSGYLLQWGTSQKFQTVSLNQLKKVESIEKSHIHISWVSGGYVFIEPAQIHCRCLDADPCMLCWAFSLWVPELLLLDVHGLVTLINSTDDKHLISLLVLIITSNSGIKRLQQVPL